MLSSRESPYRQNAHPAPASISFSERVLGPALGLVIIAGIALATAACPEAKSAANEIAVISAELCSEAATQPNDPAWVALLCTVVSDVNQVVQAEPDGGYLSNAPVSTSLAPIEVVIPRAQWDALKAAAAVNAARK